MIVRCSKITKKGFNTISVHLHLMIMITSTLINLEEIFLYQQQLLSIGECHSIIKIMIPEINIRFLFRNLLITTIMMKESCQDQEAILLQDSRKVWRNQLTDTQTLTLLNKISSKQRKFTSEEMILSTLIKIDMNKAIDL